MGNVIGEASVHAAEPGGAYDTEAVVPRLAAGTIVGEYRIEIFIAEGGMGSVYKGVHPIIGKEVAVKVLSPVLCRDATMVERFLQEARVVNAIRHPNLIDIFAFGELENGQRYLVMEWLEGATLEQRLCQGTPVPVDDVYAITLPIIDALTAAHTKGVIHRDLKPANIFLERQGETTTVKLLDFGIAKLLGSGIGERGPNTQAGFILGTPGFLAPEQTHGANVGPHSDVYSLGVVLYILLIGRKPFEGKSVIELLHKQLYAGATPPRELRPELPDELEGLLMRMLDTEPSNRPALIEIKSELVAARPRLENIAASKVSRRRLWPLVATALLLLALIVWFVRSPQATAQAAAATGTLRIHTSIPAQISVDGIVAANQTTLAEVTVEADVTHEVMMTAVGEPPTTVTAHVSQTAVTEVSFAPVKIGRPDANAVETTPNVVDSPVTTEHVAKKRKRSTSPKAPVKFPTGDRDYTLNPFH